MTKIQSQGTRVIDHNNGPLAEVFGGENHTEVTDHPTDPKVFSDQLDQIASGGGKRKKPNLEKRLMIADAKYQAYRSNLKRHQRNPEDTETYYQTITLANSALENYNEILDQLASGHPGIPEIRNRINELTIYISSLD